MAGCQYPVFFAWGYDVSRVVAINLSDEQEDYFRKCARIRNETIRCLLLDVMGIVARDQLVSAVLDDEGKTAIDRPHQHQYKGEDYPL